MQILLPLLFLPAILWAGLSASLSDIKTGKVKNRLIINGFLYGAAVHVLLFLWTVARKHSVFLAVHAGKTFYPSYHYYLDTAVNAALALTAGILLWKTGFWAAGDAKLYALMSFLLPLTAYSAEKIRFFPSFILLTNIYTVCIFYLIIYSLLRLRIKKDSPGVFFQKIKSGASGFWKKTAARFKISSALHFLNMLLIYAAIFSSLIYARRKLNIPDIPFLSQVLLYLACIVIYRPLRAFLIKQSAVNYILFPLFLAAIFFIPGLGPAFTARYALFFRFFSGFFLFFFVLRTAAMLISRQAEVRIIRPEELNAGQILGDKTICALKPEKDFLRGEIGPIYFDGLTAEQAEKLKLFFLEKKIEEVEICRTFPFAPFIFAGTIITLLLQSSLFRLISKIFQGQGG